MNTKRKTQLSLILLAGVSVIGLTGLLFHSMHKDFVLDNNLNPANQKVATPTTPAVAETSSLENGSVLGVSENANANPLQGIYVNPFANQ